jgi:hypothetical protein
MEGAPPVANQIDLFMHFLGARRDGLVARPVEMDKLSSSDYTMGDNRELDNEVSGSPKTKWSFQYDCTWLCVDIFSFVCQWMYNLNSIVWFIVYVTITHDNDMQP